MAEKQTSRRDFLKKAAALAIPTILTSKAKGDVIYNIGKLEIGNEVNDYINYQNGTFYRLNHYSLGTEGFGNHDKSYTGPSIWFPGVKAAPKIVSNVEGNLLGTDARFTDSLGLVNLELSIHTKDGEPIEVSNLENQLKCWIDIKGEGYDFSPKPITLWRRFFNESGEPGGLEFLADIREACRLHHDEAGNYDRIGNIQLPNLDGPFESQVPYDKLQVAFNRFPGTFRFDENGDGKTENMIDHAMLAADWKAYGEKIRKGEKVQPGDFLSDISGPQGVPDGKVDAHDLALFMKYWLKDPKDPSTW